MADEPLEALGGKSPLEYADTPTPGRLRKKIRDRHGIHDPGGYVAGKRHRQPFRHRI